MHGAPDSGSAVVGFVYAVIRVPAAWNLDLVLEFEPSGDPSRRGVWMENNGEWYHGVDQPGVRARGKWIQLIGPPFPSESWIDGSASGFRVDVDSIERMAVRLPALPAIFPDGERRAITPGSYFIERIAEGTVFLREEVASDLECNGAEPPAVMPPTLRANVRDFFGADGAPLFVDSNPTGCC